MNNGIDAEIILVAPSHRLEFSLDDVRRLQAQSPLSHLIVVVAITNCGVVRHDLIKERGFDWSLA